MLFPFLFLVPGNFEFFAGVKVNDTRQWRCGMAMVCNGNGQSWQSMGNPGSSGGNTIEASEWVISAGNQRNQTNCSQLSYSCVLHYINSCASYQRHQAHHNLMIIVMIIRYALRTILRDFLEIFPKSKCQNSGKMLTFWWKQKMFKRA